MLINSLIVYHLANDLKKLEGMEFVSCKQLDTNSLLLSFTDDIEMHQIEFKVAKNETALFLKDNNNLQPISNIIFNELNTDILQNVYQFNYDRIIVFEFINYKLVFILFGYGKSDVLLVAHNYVILNTFLGKYQKENNLKIILSLNDLENKILVTNQLGYSKIKVIEILYLNSVFQVKRLKFLFYNVLLFEYFNNAFNINYDTFESYDEESIKKDSNIVLENDSFNHFFNNFYKCYFKFLTELEKCNLWVLYQKENNFIILPNLINNTNSKIINKYNLKEVYKSENINLILSNGIYKYIKFIDIKDKIALYEKPLERLLVKNQKLLDNFWNGINLKQLADNYKYFADLLISLPNNKIKSGNSIKLINYENEEVTIDLDEKISLIDNAQKYYKKSNKTKKEYERRLQDLPIIEKKIELIKKLQLRLSNINNNKELKLFEEEIIKFDLINLKDLKIDNNQLNKRLNQNQMLGLKFKKFDLIKGFILFVGKDSENNDELTTKFAKPNDIWLHSKDLGGSHCIIKNNNKLLPPKDVIEQAAEICAYYSKGRNSNYVPVLYTFKKNVIKPKGAKSGAVRVNKEEVIFVTPNLSIK